MPSANHILIKLGRGTSLDVQCLRLWASNARSAGSTPGQETKIPHPVQCSKKKKKKEPECTRYEVQEYYTRVHRKEWELIKYNLKKPGGKLPPRKRERSAIAVLLSSI